MTPTALGVCVCLLALAAVQTAAQECLKAGTAADILDIVKRTRGHALICLDGQGDRVDFRSGSQLIIPENGNVTIQCGRRFIYTHSMVGPMLLGRGSVIGFQKCNVYTYEDTNQVIEAGNVENPLLTLFGNVERSVAEVSHSTVFFPKEFRQILEPGALKQLLGNTSDATLQLGPFAGDDDAAAVTFDKANFRPGLPGDAEVRFVFTQVTAWNAESFVAVNPIISEARRDRGKTELAVDWCCGPPVPLRIPPPAPRSASNTGRVAGIAAAVVVAVLMLGTAAFYLGRKRCGNAGPGKDGALSDFQPPSANGALRGPSLAGTVIARDRASSIVGPSPSTTLVKASESLSFTTLADGAPADGAAVDSTAVVGSMALLSSLSQGTPLSGDAAMDASARATGRLTWPMPVSDLGALSMASTLAASAAPRSVPGSVGAPLGAPSVDEASSSIASIGAPVSSEYRPHVTNGGTFGADELKIFDVLYRSRDSAVYQGLWRGTSVAVSVVSMRLGPRSCQRVLGTERIVAVNLDHPNVVTTYVYDSVEPADAGASGAAGRGSTRAYAVQELCNGGSLQNALLRGVLAPGVLRPRWPSILRILCGVAAGMDYMHRLRVFHGALMPSNILFKFPEGQSRSIFSALEGSTAVAKISGYTAALRKHRLAGDGDAAAMFYTAPEAPQWPRLSSSADVFAFGVIMWELMQGCLAYSQPRPTQPMVVTGAYAAVQGRGVMAGGGGGPQLPGLGLAGFDSSDADMSHHPEYPSLPATVPLTYTMVMRACLSQDASERPSFGHLVSMLEDLKTEVDSGAYVDSRGVMQPSAMIERTHQAQSVQTTRAMLQQVAAASHGLALPPPNLAASPSLSVDVAIPEEGEGEASESTLSSASASTAGPQSVVSGSPARSPRDAGGMPLAAAAAAAQPSPPSVDIGPLGFASVDEFEQQRSSGGDGADSIGDRDGWRRRSVGMPLPPAADVRLASVIGSAMHAREQVHAAQLARGSLTRDAAGDIILQPPLGGSRVIESMSSDAPSELMQDIRSRTANAVARAASSAALSSVGGTSTDNAGASFIEAPRTPASGDPPTSRSLADPPALIVEGRGSAAAVLPLSPAGHHAAGSPGSAPLPADHAATSPDSVRAYPDTDPARPLRLSFADGLDPADVLPSALMLGSPTARSPASPSLLPAAEIDSAADRGRSDTAHTCGASRELEAEFSAITGEFRARYDTGVLSPQGVPSDTVTVLSPPPSGGPSSTGSNGIAQSSRSLRAWTSAVPLSPSETARLRPPAAPSQSPCSSVDLELPRLPGAPPRAVLATVEAARLVAAENPSPRRGEAARPVHIRGAYAAPVPPTVLPPALAQPASPSRADFETPLAAGMQPMSPSRRQPPSPAHGPPGSPPPQPNVQPPPQPASPPPPKAAPAALPAPLNSWSRAAFNFVRQPLVRQPASGRPVSLTSMANKLPPASAYPISPQYQAHPAASLAPIAQPPSPPSPAPIASGRPATPATATASAAARHPGDSRSPSASPRHPNSPPSTTIFPNDRLPPTSPPRSPRCFSVRGASSSSVTPSIALSITPSVITSIPSAETAVNAEMSDPSQGGWSSRLDFTPPSFAETTDAAAGLAGTAEAASASPPVPSAATPLPASPVPPLYARVIKDNGTLPVGAEPWAAPKSLDTPAPQTLPPPYGAKQPRTEDPSPRGPASIPRSYRKPNRHKWASVPPAPGAPQSDRLPLLPTGGKLPAPRLPPPSQADCEGAPKAAIPAPASDDAIAAVTALNVGALEPVPEGDAVPGPPSSLSVSASPSAGSSNLLPCSLGERSFVF